jgi:hypothetical protein
MNSISKSSWKDCYGEAIDIATLRTKFSPPEKFRVSEYKYLAGESCGGSMLAGKCFVLQGDVTYHYDDCDLHLLEGEVAELPRGSFTLTAGTESDVELILVWEIPSKKGTA